MALLPELAPSFVCCVCFVVQTGAQVITAKHAKHANKGNRTKHFPRLGLKSRWDDMFIETAPRKPPRPAPEAWHTKGTGNPHPTPAGWRVRFHAAPLELGENSLDGVSINMALLTELRVSFAGLAGSAV